jgi:hypothetical protein
MMKKQSNLTSSLKVFVIIFAFLLSFTSVVPVFYSSVYAAGTIYYVDSASGSDTNNGTSTSTPWKTLTKVNSTTFVAGDQIQFKRGGSWTGQLYPKGSGSSGSPITIDAYGSGNLPIINGAGTMADKQGTVYFLNQQYWTVRNLEITNNAVDNGNYRSGIMVMNNGGGVTNGFIISNNYVHNVVSNAVGLPGDDPHWFGGISFRAVGTGDSFASVIIDNNTVSYSDRVGIVFWDSSYQTRSSASTSVVISNNNVSYSGGDNILLYGTDNGLIDHNIGSFATNNPALSVSNKYSAGIWPTRSYDSTVQYNESYSTQFSGDGEGFDADVKQAGAVFQYNYSHDNAGGGMLMMHDISFGQGQPADVYDITVRDSIFQNENGWGVFTFSQFATPLRLKIYNNTIYQSSTATAAIFSNCTNSSYAQTGLTDMEFKNNIVYKLNTVDYFLPDNSGVFDYNIFYGNHPSREPSDPHKLTSDPLFVSPGTGGNGINTVNGYQLQASSPAINSGTLITESYAPHNGNGGKDYWGNAVSAVSAPNRGAYNGAVVLSGTVTNPGFESGSLSPWTTQNNGSVVPNNAHSGTYALNTGQSNSGADQVITGLTPNTTYVLKAWVKNTAADSIYLGVKNYGGTETNVNTNATVYTQLSVEFTTGSTNTSAGIYVWKNAGTAVSFADDFTLTVKNLVSNPGFETGTLPSWTNSGTATVVTGNAKSGTYAANIGTANTGVLQTITGLSPNSSYTLTAWVKNTAADKTYLGVKNYGGVETNVNTLATTYTQLTMTFTTGASSTSADIYAWKNAGTAASYVDDFTLVKN